MTIRYGDRGSQVKIVQQALGLLPDGIFGRLTLERVLEYQKENGLRMDGIVGDNTWAMLMSEKPQAPQPTVVGNLKRSRREIREIIIHCTATPEGRDVTKEEITSWHKQRGFSTIGYHYLVQRNGCIEEGRDVNVSGAHCEGHNSRSLGVCYVGGMTADGKKPKDTRTPQQKQQLLNLLKQLRSLYPSARIYGHRDFAKKDCPCFDAKSEYKAI